MISVEDYFMGRDAAYPLEVTNGLRANVRRTVERVNQLLEQAAADGVEPAIDATSGSQVASGWRPRAVNDATAHAAKASTHIVGLAVDLRDTPGRELARWCCSHLDVLEALGLFMEDPRWTPTWVHLQIVPPGSGKRVYVPSSAPAMAAALPEQDLA